MRLAVLFAVGACSPPPPVMPANQLALEACDEAMWHAQAASPMRAKLGDRDLIVVDACYGVAHVIAKLPGMLVASTVNDRRLARVVTRETPLLDGPGGPPVPGVVVEPGAVVTGAGDWRRVAVNLGIDATGYVPTAATGLLWSATTVPPATAGKRLGRSAEVVAEPHPDAAHLASIGANDYVFEQIESGPSGWLHVVASDNDVRVTGWVAPPSPPSHSAFIRDYDFSDDTIEGALVRPEGEDGAPMGPTPPRATGCIRTEPAETGHVIGLVTGDVRGTLEDGGWVRLELATPWGHVTGHAREKPDAR